jgi:hypothetical protein
MGGLGSGPQERTAIVKTTEFANIHHLKISWDAWSDPVVKEIGRSVRVRLMMMNCQKASRAGRDPQSGPR